MLTASRLKRSAFRRRHAAGDMNTAGGLLVLIEALPAERDVPPPPEALGSTAGGLEKFRKIRVPRTGSPLG